MKKLSVILVLMVMVGISLFSISSNSIEASQTRTIPMKTGVALSANTVVASQGGTLYKIFGRATAAQADYVIYDRNTIASATGLAANSQANILTEGGEATQYDTIEPVDFGSEGLSFSTGMVIVTTTADIVVHYR